MFTERKHTKTENLDTKISKILTTGIVLSVSLIIIGLILVFFLDYNQDSFSYNSLSTLLKAIIQHPLSPYAFLMSGIIILCLTPIIRVLASCIIFLKERDNTYFLITLIVLLLLISEIIYSLNIH